MTNRSPWPRRNDRLGPPPRGRNSKGRAAPTETIAITVSWRRWRIRVAVPGHLSRPSRYQHSPAVVELLRAVVAVEGVEGPHQRRVGQLLRVGAPRGQPRHVHRPLVHHPVPLPPRHVVAQGVEDFEVVGEPAGEDDPPMRRAPRPIRWMPASSCGSALIPSAPMRQGCRTVIGPPYRTCVRSGSTWRRLVGNEILGRSQRCPVPAPAARDPRAAPTTVGSRPRRWPPRSPWSRSSRATVSR